MAHLWIKICGMTTPEAILAAAEAGADAVGFVFYEPSPRNLTIERAVELRAHVPRALQAVAVFLHPTRELVDSVVTAVRPDLVQADLADLERLGLPCSQIALPVVRSGSLPGALPPRVLLESARSGHGERADWGEARSLGAAREIVLAGGLHEGNVADAIAAATPWGVDVSSGVEVTRGRKDVDLIRRFVATARTAAASAGANRGESQDAY
jgi:phosphoribosylanthranilate isomerase